MWSEQWQTTKQTTKAEIVDFKKNVDLLCKGNKSSHIASPYSGILLQWAAKAMLEINLTVKVDVLTIINPSVGGGL